MNAGVVDNLGVKAYDAAHEWRRAKKIGLLLLVTLTVFSAVCSSNCIAGTIETHTAAFPGKGSYEDWSKANAHFNQGVDLANAGKYEEAIQKYKEAIAIYSYAGIYYSNMGLCYQKKGDLPRAEATYRKSIEVQPVWQAWGNLGNLLQLEGRLPEAKEAFQKALGMRPPANVVSVLQKDIANLTTSK